MSTHLYNEYVLSSLVMVILQLFHIVYAFLALQKLYELKTKFVNWLHFSKKFVWLLYEIIMLTRRYRYIVHGLGTAMKVNDIFQILNSLCSFSYILFYGVKLHSRTLLTITVLHWHRNENCVFFLQVCLDCSAISRAFRWTAVSTLGIFWSVIMAICRNGQLALCWRVY